MNPDPVTTGSRAMSELSVVICGIARDCAMPLANLIPRIERLGAGFSDYEVVVVENNSADDTRGRIEEWARNNHRVSADCFTLPPDTGPAASGGWFSEARVARICQARNRYMEALESRQSDYVIILDLDLLDFSIEGVADSFAQRDRWHVSAGNGMRYTLRSPFSRAVYWDTYAFEPEGGFAGGVQRLEFLRDQQRALANELARGEPIQARSAFGGLCIYRYESLAGHRYDVVPNDDTDIPVLCEHVALHRAMHARDPETTLLINPAQKVRYEKLRQTLKRSIRQVLN